MKTAYLSLGSNLGDREGHLQAALEHLQVDDLRVIRQSSIFETEPRDLRSQPWFLNLVVEIETRFFPMQLLAHTQKIEREMGRKRLVSKGPRVIDIDILLYARFVVETGALQIPHPRMGERRFVLEPLAELAPDLRHPVSRKKIRELLEGVGDQIVRRWP